MRLGWNFHLKPAVNNRNEFLLSDMILLELTDCAFQFGRRPVPEPRHNMPRVHQEPVVRFQNDGDELVCAPAQEHWALPE